MASPFDNVRTAPAGSFRESILGFPTQKEAVLQQQSGAREIILRKLQELQGGGAAPNQVMQQMLQSPEFLEAFTAAPDAKALGELVTEMLSSTVAPTETISSSEIPKDVFENIDNLSEGQQRFIGAAPDDPPAAVALVNEILKAKHNGDEDRVKLLMRSLPQATGADDKLSGNLALKVRAAGEKTGNAFIDAMTPEKAQEAHNLGMSAGQGYDIDDMAMRVAGEKTGIPVLDEATPQVVAAAIMVRKEGEPDQPSDIAALLQAGQRASEGGGLGVPERPKTATERIAAGEDPGTVFRNGADAAQMPQAPQVPTTGDAGAPQQGQQAPAQQPQQQPGATSTPLPGGGATAPIPSGEKATVQTIPSAEEIRKIKDPKKLQELRELMLLRPPGITNDQVNALADQIEKAESE